MSIPSSRISLGGDIQKGYQGWSWINTGSRRWDWTWMKLGFDGVAIDGRDITSEPIVGSQAWCILPQHQVHQLQWVWFRSWDTWDIDDMRMPQPTLAWIQGRPSYISNVARISATWNRVDRTRGPTWRWSRTLFCLKDQEKAKQVQRRRKKYNLYNYLNTIYNPNQIGIRERES